MDLELKGKVAWVLGGSSGLGAASATSMAREGAAVAISSRDADKLASTAAEIEESTGGRCLAAPADVTDPAALAGAHGRVVDELGGVDVLVANAGGPPPGGFADFDDDALYGAFTLTAASAWRAAKLVVPAMESSGAGVLIFLTSGSTKEVIPGLLLSNMMRAAVVGMAKTLSKELGPHGVRALCVAPGRIETARLVEIDNANAQRTGRSVEEVRKSLQSTIPLGRYGEPSEFGDVVAFLASARASYVSGCSVMVDGGQLDTTHA